MFGSTPEDFFFLLFFSLLWKNLEHCNFHFAKIDFGREVGVQRAAVGRGSSACSPGLPHCCSVPMPAWPLPHWDAPADAALFLGSACFTTPCAGPARPRLPGGITAVLSLLLFIAQQSASRGVTPRGGRCSLGVVLGAVSHSACLQRPSSSSQSVHSVVDNRVCSLGTDCCKNFPVTFVAHSCNFT